MTGKHASTVGYWVKKHDLAAAHRTRHAARGGIAVSELEPLVAEGLPLREIASRLDVSLGTVRHWMKRYGLRSPARPGVRHALPGDDKYRELICARHGTTTFVMRNDTPSYRCVLCRGAAVSRRRQKVKRILVEEAGGRCEICGYDRCNAALEFHHLNRLEKAFIISREGSAIALDRLRQEARKCALLCANCHAEVEAGIRTMPNGRG